MKVQDLHRRIDEIVTRLSQLAELDKEVIQPQSSTPITLPIEKLFAYGERFEEREKLHEELRGLSTIQVD